MDKQLKKISKFLSLLLRHKPETVGIRLDSEGWIDVDTLIEACAEQGKNFDRATLDQIVKTNDKQRFTYSPCGTRIRANQGHSIEVDLNLEAREPPATLLHGTASRFVDEILEKGLQKQSRQHVHLSTNATTAGSVGQRHGKVVIFEVNARQMHADGFEFYLSKNGVWLTEEVPSEYLKVRFKVAK